MARPAADHRVGAEMTDNPEPISWAKRVEERLLGRALCWLRASAGRQRQSAQHISGLPTAKLRDRLAQMAYNAGVAVIAVRECLRRRAHAGDVCRSGRDRSNQGARAKKRHEATIARSREAIEGRWQ